MVRGKPKFRVQLQKVIDELLKSGDARALDVFLQRHIFEGTPIKCSQQFLTKLDKLVSRVRCSPAHSLICHDALLFIGLMKLYLYCLYRVWIEKIPNQPVWVSQSFTSVGKT